LGGAAGRLEPGVPGAWAARTDAARYDGEIRWVDGRLGGLFAELDRRGLGETTLVLVTADHGEEFLEHGERTHGKNFYDTSLRVPMILRLPGGAHAGRRIATPVSLVDVGATLVAAAGGGASTWHSGRDLAGLLGAAPDRAWRERELYATGKARGGGLLTALIADGRKVVVRADREGRPRREALTVTAPQRDPGEKSLEPLRARETARWRRRLLAAWDAQRATARPPAAAAPADAEERAALRALGYL
jgi:arylsulfatase A-like enzyme